MNTREIVQSIYDAAQTSDLAAIERVLADDVVLHEPPHHPAVLGGTAPGQEPGIWRGRDAAMAGIGEVFGALRLTGADLQTIVVDGDRAVGLLNVRGTDHEGNPYSMPMAEVFTVSGGKVVEIWAFYWDVTELCGLVGVHATA
jgi:ketosteroid isomerase-like protein